MSLFPSFAISESLKAPYLLAVLAAASRIGDGRPASPGHPRRRHTLFQLVEGLTTSAESVISLLSSRLYDRALHLSFEQCPS